MRSVNAGFQTEQIMPYFQRHHDFFQAGIARTFAQTVDGAFDLACARLNRRQRIGHRHAQIVVAVARPDDFTAVRHAVDDGADAFIPRRGNRIAHGIGNVDGGGARFDNGRENLHQEIVFGTHGVFGGKFHVIGIFFGDFHRFHRGFHHLLRLHFQLVFHVDGAGGDEGVDAAFGCRGKRFACFADVVFHRAAQRADGGIFHGFGDFVHGFPVAFASGGKTRFNHVYTQFFQLARQTQLFFFGHGCAGRLFAVAHGGVEYDDAVVCVHGVFFQFCLLVDKGVQIQRPPLCLCQRGQFLQLVQGQRTARAPFVDGGGGGGVFGVLLFQGFGKRVHAAKISD